MSEPLYEFTPPKASAPPRRNRWTIALLLSPLIAAAVWGIVILEQRRAENLLKESFAISTDFRNRVIAAVAQVPDVKAEHLHALSDYPHLQMVGLQGTTTVPGGLRPLWQIDDLRVLDLQGCKWFDDEIAVQLSELTSLKRLNLSGTAITDAGLQAIRSLPNLISLRIRNCPGITDAGLEFCATLPGLRSFSVGGTTPYTIEKLFDFRERRRDLILHLDPADLLPSEARTSSLDDPDHPLRVSVHPEGDHNIAMRVSTAADVEFLRNFLRFKQNWNYRAYREEVQLRNVKHEHRTSYLEHVEETWKELDLSGPAAGPSLGEILPLTPHLEKLRLNETWISEADSPVDLLPKPLCEIQFDNMAVSTPLVLRLTEHPTLRVIALVRVPLDGVEVIEARIGDSVVRSYDYHPADRPVDDRNGKSLSEMNLYAKPVNPSLERLLPILPHLTVLQLNADHDDISDFPFDRLPATLRQLNISRATMKDDFLRLLSQHDALKQLRLYGVHIGDMDLADPALGHLTSLESLRLQYVQLNGVDIADPALEPIRARLKNQLSQTHTVIEGGTHRIQRIEWGTPPAE